MPARSRPSPYAVARRGPALVVRFAAHVRELTALEIDGRLLLLAGNAAGADVHLDLRHVERLGATGLGKLFALRRRVTARGGRCVLRHAGPAVCEALAITRLDRYFDVLRGASEAPPAAALLPA